MKKGLNRREFFRRIGIGTIGLGFGVSIFDGIYQYANALTEVLLEGPHHQYEYVYIEDRRPC